MKLAAPIRCRHCGRAVTSPDDPDFYSHRFTVTDPHMDRWSCSSCITFEEKREIVLELNSPSPDVIDLVEVTPEDIDAAAREEGLARQDVLLLHQFVNISWRAQGMAVGRGH
jgi:hypothetical protein